MMEEVKFHEVESISICDEPSPQNAVKDAPNHQECSQDKECRICFRGPQDFQGVKKNHKSTLDKVISFLRCCVDPYHLLKPKKKSLKDEMLIQPCKCKGTLRYVHRSCLETWLTLHAINENSFTEVNDDFIPEFKTPTLK